VAIILRVCIPGNDAFITSFLQDERVKQGHVQVLFIERSKRPGDRWSGHIAFPGGKKEVGETDRDAAERETREEVGLDLTSSSFAYLGELDQQHVTASFGNQLLMIVCAFVYLQVVGETPPLTLSVDEVERVHWVPLEYLLTSVRRNVVQQPIAPRILPHLSNRWMHKIVHWMVGSTYWEGIPLPDSASHLWGLTLVITDDVLRLCTDDHTVRRRLHWPDFDKWEFALWIRLLRWMFIRAHSTHADRMFVIKYGALLAVMTRVAVLWFTGRQLYTWTKRLVVIH
jgi:8-oxo-dGTP pyrophosphatase MutT (NUDIX family)